MSLKNKTLVGLVWVGFDTIILRGASFISTILLARWLGPSEFGLIGMISVFIAIGGTIVDSGMTASIIRLKAAKEEDLTTVFYMNMGLSILFYLIIFLVAPLISDFYRQPVLTNLLRVYSLSFVISGFSAVQLAILNSKMEFKKIMQLNMPGTILGVIGGLTFGYFKYGVWSVVFMYLITQFFQSCVLWLKSDWRPKLLFSVDSARLHFKFGYKLMLSGLLNTVFQNIYNIIIGRYYSVKELGFFERARSLNEYPVTILNNILGKVTYPLLSKIRDDKNKISEVYRNIIKLSFFITCPLMFSVAAVATPLFNLILGPEWSKAIQYFQIICLASVFYPVHVFNLNIFKVYGRSELFLKLEIIKKVIILLGVFIGFKFGVLGLVWSSVICNFLALFVNTYYSSDLVNYSSKQQILDFIPTFIISGLIFCVVKYIVSICDNFNNVLLVFGGGILSLSLYFVTNYIIKSDSLLYTYKLLKKK